MLYVKNDYELLRVRSMCIAAGAVKQIQATETGRTDIAKLRDMQVRAFGTHMRIAELANVIVREANGKEFAVIKAFAKNSVDHDIHKVLLTRYEDAAIQWVSAAGEFMIALPVVDDRTLREAQNYAKYVADKRIEEIRQLAAEGCREITAALVAKEIDSNAAEIHIRSMDVLVDVYVREIQGALHAQLAKSMLPPKI